MNSAEEASTPLSQRLGEELSSQLEIIRPLGEGRRSRVFLAREAELGRLVVVKVLSPEEASDDTARARFEREARSVAALTHPNVVQLYRYGVLSDGTPYLVMQHVEGRTLEERLAARGPVSTSQARNILRDVASALAAAHRRGIVHRDVRPGTVLLEEESGRALLNDFGVAGILDTAPQAGPRITRTGQILGTPEHQSPEQIRGEPLTTESDVYALGILGYEILTGDGPYEAKSKRELLAAHLQKEPRPLPPLSGGSDPILTDLLKRCLAKEPGRRPRASDVIESLEDDARSGGTSAPDGLFGNLRQKKMLQWLGGAGAGGWLLLQVVDQLDQQELIPALVYPLALAFVLSGIVATGILAWYHGERGEQSVTRTELWLLSAVGLIWITVSTYLVLR